jgi:hypothetical protein
MGHRARAPSLKGAALMFCDGLSPPMVALALAGLVALFAGLSLLADATGGYAERALQFGVGFTLTGLVAGVLMVTVSGLAVLHGRARRAVPPVDSRAAATLAILAGLAAIDVAGSIHERLWEPSGTAAQLALPPLLVGLSLVLLGGWLVRGTGRALAIWLAGGLAWEESLALDLGDSGYHLAIIELAGACLFALAMLVAVRATTATRRSVPSGAAVRNAALQALHSVSVGALAVGLGVAILALCVAGVVVGHGLGVAAFDLDQEQTIPPLFSGALLLLAAGLGLAARAGGGDVAWLAISGVLAMLALDELLKGHERLQALAPGTGETEGSHLVLLPYAALVAYIWVLARRRLSGHRRASMLWLGGAALWVVSQSLDVVNLVRGEADVDTELHWNWVAQEGLEMAGSAALLLALVLFLQGTLERPGPDAASAARGPESRPGAARGEASVGSQ